MGLQTIFFGILLILTRASFAEVVYCANTAAHRFNNNYNSTDCSATKEGDLATCAECKEVLNRDYPLRQQDFLRSYTPGDKCAFKQAADSLELNKEVTVAVIGGSMTAGHNCRDSVLGELEHCAWPRRLQDWLRSEYPCWNLNITNYAQPGWSSETWVTSGKLHELAADIFIIDLAVNAQAFTDSYLMMWYLDLLIYTILHLPHHSSPPAILFVETFRTCSFTLSDCNRHCEPLHQASMSVQLAGKVRDYTWCNRWWTIEDFDAPILKHYQLPVASYRDAVWPELTRPSPLLHCFWNGLSHPDATAHQLISDVVANALVDMLKVPDDLSCDVENHQQQRRVTGTGLQRVVTPFHQRLPVSGYCAERRVGPLESTQLSVQEPETFKPRTVVGDWAFREDVPSKPGWVAETNRTHMNHTIDFLMNFSERPQLEVTYLTTYKNIGAVSMYIGPPGLTAQSLPSAYGRYELTGLRDTKHSIPHTFTLSHGALASRGRSAEIPKGVGKGQYVVLFALDMSRADLKFKLLGLRSC